MNTVIIKNAKVVDGTGGKPFKGDILIENGKIREVSPVIERENTPLLDAQGLIASPGFIDAHSHNELVIMRDRQQSRALTQGVTTEITAQCGLGCAPATPELLPELIRLYSGILGDYDPKYHNWTDFGDYLSRLDGCGINVASPVAHGPIRAIGAGFSSRKLEGRELERSLNALEEAMEQGALGLSTGLTYYPAGYSDTEELIRLCSVVKKYGGIYLVHKRDNYTSPRDMGNDESVRILRETGVRTHILHYKTGAGSAGNIDGLMKPYQAAIDEGLDISFELYPYSVGAGFGLVFLPPWVMEGGFDAVMNRLADKSLRAKILTDMEERCSYLLTAEGASFCALSHTTEYIGKTFAEVMKIRGQGELEMILDILYENQLCFGYRYNPIKDNQVEKTIENDWFTLLDLPNYTVGSDAIAFGDFPHPRATGTFPKLLRLAREKNYPIEKLINKITKYTADRFRLKSKGRIASGMDADICIFDPQTVTERGGFDNPRLMAKGIKYVLVNGKLALMDGQPTGILAGASVKPS